jgi:hypothetical protein
VILPYFPLCLLFGHFSARARAPRAGGSSDNGISSIDDTSLVVFSGGEPDGGETA